MGSFVILVGSGLAKVLGSVVDGNVSIRIDFRYFPIFWMGKFVPNINEPSTDEACAKVQILIKISIKCM